MRTSVTVRAHLFMKWIAISPSNFYTTDRQTVTVYVYFEFDITGGDLIAISKQF